MGALRGVTESREMSPDIAIKFAEKALRLDRDDDRSHMALARTLLFAGRKEEAFAAIQEALKLNPASAFHHYMAGRILNKLDRAEEGLKYAEVALRLSPRDLWISPFLVCIGEAHFLLGNYETTIEWTDKALREANALWIPAALKTVAHFKLGRMQEAWQTVAELKRRFPAITLASLAKNPWLLNLPNNKDFMEILLAAGLPENSINRHRDVKKID